jgi:hypothetical protein
MRMGVHLGVEFSGIPGAVVEGGAFDIFTRMGLRRRVALVRVIPEFGRTLERIFTHHMRTYLIYNLPAPSRGFNERCCASQY